MAISANILFDCGLRIAEIGHRGAADTEKERGRDGEISMDRALLFLSFPPSLYLFVSVALWLSPAAILNH
jgi:hypothetical protein